MEGTTTDDFTETLPADEGLSDAISADDTPNIIEDVVPAEDLAPAMEEPIISEDTLLPSGPEDQLGQGQNQGHSGVGGDLFGDLASPIEDGEGDLTEKILQDLETQTKTENAVAPAQYVAPPDYEYQGRGLVYNCQALHWACVDGPSYKVCEENSAYQQENAKTPECYPFNIYETTKGCTNMQNRMVSSGASTDFCKGF